MSSETDEAKDNVTDILDYLRAEFQRNHAKRLYRIKVCTCGHHYYKHDPILGCLWCDCSESYDHED